MEAEVTVRCRKSDHAIVVSILDSAADEYRKLMKREVKIFKDREVPLKLILEDSKFLSEFNDTEGADSCMGGIMMHARKGRIVCTNTLDERLQLVYQEAIPDIRKSLFPSFKKEEKKPSEVSHVKHH